MEAFASARAGVKNAPPRGKTGTLLGRARLKYVRATTRLQFTTPR
jgi:hypothetical protein